MVYVSHIHNYEIIIYFFTFMCIILQCEIKYLISFCTVFVGPVETKQMENIMSGFSLEVVLRA